jgi:hypothetical protein
MVNAQSLHSFARELTKTAAGRDIGQLLAGLATRQGVRPSLVPSIKQVQHIATKDRGRAAEVARNVRSALKSKALQEA